MHTNNNNFSIQAGTPQNFGQAGSKYAQQFGVINERQLPITLV